MRRFKSVPRRVAIALSSLSAAVAAPALADQFSFGLHLYSPPAGLTQDLSIGVPLAKDGSAVGATFGSSTTLFGAAITPNGTVNFLSPSRAFDISDGGTYIVDFLNRRGASGAIDQVLPANTQYRSQDFTPHISGNGSIIAGSTEVFTFGTVSGSNAYRWTEQGGLQSLPGYRANAIFTTTEGLSQDGSTTVGRGRTQFFGYEQAWKWSPGTGFTTLPTVPGAFSTDSAAYGVNSDGSIIVGRGAGPTSDTGRALVWRGDQVTELLPLPGYRVSDAYDLSDDGSVISGINTFSDVGLPRISTIWTSQTGWLPALDYFRMQGIEIPSYYTTASTINVSADGRTFSTTLFDTRTSQGIMAVIAIPSPGGVLLLGVAAVFSRRTRQRRPPNRNRASVVAAAVAASAAVATPAMADQFAFGLHLYAPPAGLTQDQSIGVPLAKDGSAVGATFYPSSSTANARYGARITPSGIVTFVDPSKAFDISDGGVYTVDLRTRRSASGAIDQILPANTLYRSQDFTPHISGNGSIIVGSTEVFSSGTVVGSNAYRWTEQGGLQALPGYRPDAIFTTPEGLSQDGSTMVGSGRPQFFGNEQAWKWTAGSGYTILPTVPGAYSTNSAAYAANSNGSIIVGYGQGPTSDTNRALVWTGNQPRELLALPGYRTSIAYDLCDDGSVISGINGFSDIGLPDMSTIWTDSTGWVPALDYFRMQGIDVPSYLAAAGPVNISGDGSTFSMQMYDTRTAQYYISVIAIPSPGVMPMLGIAFVLSRRARGPSRSL